MFSKKLAALFTALVLSFGAFGDSGLISVNGKIFKVNGSLFTKGVTAAPPAACDYYIGTGGSDSNAGTEGSPWAITAINTKRSTYSGKTVCLEDGTYNRHSALAVLTSFDDWDLDVEGGTSGSPTTIRALNPRQAIITGKSGSNYGVSIDTGVPGDGCSPMLGHSGTTSHRGYVVFDGLVLTGVGRFSIRVGHFNSSPQIEGIVIKNMEFTDNSATTLKSGLNLPPLELNNTNGALIQNNYFHDNVGYSAQSGDHMYATLQWQSVGSIYEYNTIIQSGNIYGKENQNSGTTIRYNYIDNTGWGNTPAIYDFVGVPTDTASGINNEIHHNIAIGATGFVFRPSLGSGYFKDTTNIYNNTILTVNSGQTISIGARADDGKLNAYNNLISSSASGDQNIAIWNVGAPGTIDYNYYYNSSAYQYGYFSSKSSDTRVGANFATYKSTLGGIEAHSTSPGSDPLFVGTGSRADYYKLQSGSPAKNFGKSNGTTGGTTVDAGAWGNSPPSRIGCDF